MKSVLVVGLLGTTSCAQEPVAKDVETEVVEVNVPSKSPKNIIFLIGDGMGLTQITAGLITQRDALNLERCPIVGLSKTNSGDNLITDSAAGATAFATGKKTYNGAIGVDMDTLPLTTILEIAERSGLATGLVATSSITHATPASFIAHQKSRAMDEAIAADFLKTEIDVFIGGGKKFFEQRTDHRNLIQALTDKGYSIATGMEEISSVSDGKLAGFIAEEHPTTVTDGRGQVLAEATLKAIELLSKNEKGFFLMSEGSQIDWGGHANDSEYIISEMQDFDYMVGKVLDFAKENGETLVVITADHETGGYGIVGGNLEAGEIETKFLTDYHTGTMVPVFAFGPGAE
ncbi:MAG: alkaline phosphatase, partial [Flavobacteriales bacterium]|nr:alkaline phosphatase [Flavobacteriales bacterium]